MFWFRIRPTVHSSYLSCSNLGLDFARRPLQPAAGSHKASIFSISMALGSEVVPVTTAVATANYHYDGECLHCNEPDNEQAGVYKWCSRVGLGKGKDPLLGGKQGPGFQQTSTVPVPHRSVHLSETGRRRSIEERS